MISDKRIPSSYPMINKDLDYRGIAGGQTLYSFIADAARVARATAEPETRALREYYEVEYLGHKPVSHHRPCLQRTVS